MALVTGSLKHAIFLSQASLSQPANKLVTIDDTTHTWFIHGLFRLFKFFWQFFSNIVSLLHNKCAHIYWYVIDQCC